MKLTDKNILANQIFGEDANEVLNFLETVAPNKHEFRTQKTFLNFIARKLEPMLKSKARQSKLENVVLRKTDNSKDSTEKGGEFIPVLAFSA